MSVVQQLWVTNAQDGHLKVVPSSALYVLLAAEAGAAAQAIGVSPAPLSHFVRGQTSAQTEGLGMTLQCQDHLESRHGRCTPGMAHQINVLLKLHTFGFCHSLQPTHQSCLQPLSVSLELLAQ